MKCAPCVSKTLRFSSPLHPSPFLSFLEWQTALWTTAAKTYFFTSVRPSVEIEFRNRGHSAAAAAATAVSAPDLPKAIGVVQREREEREREGGRMDSAGIWPAVASKRQQGRARAAAAAAVAAVRPVWRIDKKSNTFTLAWPS